MDNFIQPIDTLPKNFSGKLPFGYAKMSVNAATVLNSKMDFEKMSDMDLYKYCKETGFNARIWNRRFIAAIPEVAKRRLYKKYGYCSIHEFAAKLACINNDNVDEVLRVDEKLKEMPKIKSLIAEKGLNKVRLVANIAKPETEKFWADKIENMTFSSLRIFINEKFRFETETKNNAGFVQEKDQIDMFGKGIFKSRDENESIGSKNDKKTFTIQIDDETEFELRKFKLQLEKEKKEPVDWNTALKEMASRLASRAVKQSAKRAPNNDLTYPFGNKPVSRYIPSKIRSDLEQKHRGRCAYHGCNKPAEEIHHPERFAARPNHENLLPLCKAHHDFVHQVVRQFVDRKFNIFKREGLPGVS